MEPAMPSSTTKTIASGPASEAAASLEYNVRPLGPGSFWRELPPRLVIVAGLLAYMVSGSVRLAVLAAGIMALAAWRSFVPVQYAVDAQGIHQRVLGRRR